MTEALSPRNLLALIIEDDPKLAIIFSAAFQQAGYQTEVSQPFGRFSLRKFLRFQQAGYQTEVSQDGQTALERLATLVPDVVILDLHLPFVSGMDILQRIRADERLAQAHVIVVTADLFKADAIGDQADAILFKPISFIELQNLATNWRTSQTAKL